MNHDDKKYFEELFIRHGEELFAKQREEFQHFVSVIIKDSDRKFALLSEGHQTLSEKIDRLEVKQDNLSDRVDRLELKVDHLSQKQDQFAEKLDQLAEKQEEFSESLGRVESKIDKHLADTHAHHGVYLVHES